VTIESVAVVGLGRLGACLLRALQAAGVHVTAVTSKRESRAEQLIRELHCTASVTTLEQVAHGADVVFLAVPDAEIAQVGARLSVGPGQSVVHCSGALDRSPLTAAGEGGAALGVFHPLQSFGPDAPAERFGGVALGIDADPPLFGALAHLAEQIGARPFSLAGVDRARYHAAAVFTSNYLVALHAAAARIWDAAGLPGETAREALVALSQGAVDNLRVHELAQALTGPIARGDAAVVARQIAALAGDPPSQQLYRALARELLQLPLGHSAEVQAALRDALTEPS
jgi:predicted short-subunit dehydrogenase-like oxidoreductase (DUF2520 family)